MFAVVVTYGPEVAATAELLRALAPQVGSIIIVDNGSSATTIRDLAKVAAEVGAKLRLLGSNLGIAAAQNIGIAWAREHGAHFILLSDQDSLPAPDMVSRLLAGLANAATHALDEGGLPPAAVGPITVDQRNRGAVLIFASQRWGPRRAVVPEQDGALIDATFLIASGCLIDMEALDVIGPMNESWFIDHIDLEWGLRARRAGFGVYGVVGAKLAHSLGDRTQRIPGRARDVHIHSPVRNYYMARNTILLIRSGLLTTQWAWGYAAWITKYSVFYALTTAPRIVRAKLLLRGLRDGCDGQGGPLAQPPSRRLHPRRATR
ncbi:glycosyltransferase family 2 protein [Cellulomonas sp. WB94]|uniref:glycosyltransferase family 2 protein n=1 Tax=Cellulomonas sp. WB94 TaxID=2173174 RepID=UPI0018D582C9|nr:glycosyltransferase family 2 protein [Cellulomonas sp. WB94]